MRKEVTDLLLRDFGYDLDKAVKKVETTFGGRPYEELSPDEKVRYEKLMEKNTAFAEWFIADERKVIVDCLRSITEEVYVANSIYPTYREELIERRVHQDRAVGQCYRLTQELQYAIETLPVGVNKYLRFAEMIQTEINLLKGGNEMYTITLANGKNLTGLDMNGTNYVSKEKVDETIFKDNLYTMKVSDGETETTYTDMVFIQQMEWADGTFYLAFREKTKEEKLVAALNATSNSITDVQVALAEVYEMVLGGN